MASDWFENDNLKRTVQQLLVGALTEMEVDFYRLDTVVQATLLDEAMQVGVQHSLVPLMRIKAVMEAANADPKPRTTCRPSGPCGEPVDERLQRRRQRLPAAPA